MRPHGASDSNAQNPYAPGKAVNNPEPTQLPLTMIAVSTAIITGIFAAGIGYVCSWAAIGLILTLIAPQASYSESITAMMVFPGVIAFLTGITAGMRVGRKLHSMLQRMGKVKQRRADLTAHASLMREDLRRMPRAAQQPERD